MSINYGTIIGGNVPIITDPYYPNILRGWMPEGLIYKDIYPQMPTTTYKGRIPKQNAQIQIRSSYV